LGGIGPLCITKKNGSTRSMSSLWFWTLLARYELSPESLFGILTVAEIWGLRRSAPMSRVFLSMRERLRARFALMNVLPSFGRVEVTSIMLLLRSVVMNRRLLRNVRNISPIVPVSFAFTTMAFLVAIATSLLMISPMRLASLSFSNSFVPSIFVKKRSLR